MCKDIEKIKKLLKDNLIMLAEYNNGDEKRCLAVCNFLDFDTITDLKKLKFPPTIFTEIEIKNSIEIFPVEFLNIKRNHKLLYGNDIFADIQISREKLRDQLKFEIRSKLIHLRQLYLTSDKDNLNKIILNAVPTLAPMVGATMYLKNMDTKYDSDLVKVMIGIDTRVLQDIHYIRVGKKKFNKHKEKYIEKLINLLNQIGDIVDKI